MGHHHEHEHHHGAEALKIEAGMGKVYGLSIGLNLVFVAVEAIVGFWNGSMGLVSDAGHNLSDVLALVLALIAFWLVKRDGEKARHKASWIAFVNALLLAIAIIAIIWESVEKLTDGGTGYMDGAVIGWTAGVGIIVNGITTWLLSRGNKDDLNRKGAYLHMLADTLVSVGVVISGILIYFTGWYLIDTVVSLAIAVILIGSCWGLIKESYLALKEK
ncbi:MAG: cation diffusion facilitator family transporter [Bacteroidales bacterium]|nr:cation diffusion facilitator family transporter [Bacteroidales bacterium]